MPNSTAAPIEGSIFQVMKEASLLYCLPDNPFFLDPENSNHAVQEATYACGYITQLPRYPSDHLYHQTVAGSLHNTFAIASGLHISI